MVRTILVSCALCIFSVSALAELELPSIFGDHMVLQRDTPIAVWGHAQPGRKVHVVLDGADGVSHFVRTDDAGDWIVHLSPMPASADPRQLVIESIKSDGSVIEHLAFSDVLVGEVWVCSGQSNMQWTLSASGEQNIDTATADHDQLRMFTAERTSHPQPKFDVNGSWVVCSAQSAPRLSAVAYYFGRELQRELGVPIGLVHTSWGGSSAEAWTSIDMLASLPETLPILHRFEQSMQPDADAAEFTSLIHDDVDWESVTLPSLFKDQGEDLDGVVWYRKHLQVPASWKGRDLELTLGAIDDADHTYFNGLQVGRGTDWQAPRRYVIPSAIVDVGPTVLAVRVQDDHGLGGFSGSPEEMRLGPVDDASDRIAVDGTWVRHISTQPRSREVPANHKPAHLANGMLEPIIPFAMRGAIWYQGESNVGRAAQYEVLFPAMIQDWRNRWGQGDFPFYFVQIAPYNYGQPEACAELRESQAAALRLPATGMAVTMDVGNPADIHPKNKEPVGHRLALLALANDYGHDVPAAAPTCVGMEVEGDTLVLRFAGDCLPLATSDANGPTHFEIAGADQIFHSAQVEVRDQSIGLRSDVVSKPVAARFAWDDDAEPNLTGQCGLPVAPFRTDRWLRVTEGKW